MALKVDLGSILTGSYFAVLLFGLETVAAYTYFFRSKRRRGDHWLLQGTIVVCLVANLAGIIGVCAQAWILMVSRWGTFSIIPVLWAPYVWIVDNAVSGILVQSFMVFRYWRLTSYRLIPVVIMLVAAASFAMSLVTIIYSAAFAASPDRRARVLRFVAVTLIATALTDLMISIALLQQLISRSRRSVNIATKRLLRRVAVNSIQCGLATTLIAVGAIIGNFPNPRDQIATPFAMQLGRAYTLTILYTLLSRPSHTQTNVVNTTTQHYRVSDNTPSHRTTPSGLPPPTPVFLPEPAPSDLALPDHPSAFPTTTPYASSSLLSRSQSSKSDESKHSYPPTPPLIAVPPRNPARGTPRRISPPWSSLRFRKSPSDSPSSYSTTNSTQDQRYPPC